MWYAFNGDRQERPGDYRTSESRYGAETDDQEVRITRPEINEGKICVKRLLNEKYRPIFKGEMNSSELWRYNFFIYQLENEESRLSPDGRYRP